jgi:nucleoid-associated protein YgaU
MAGVGSKNGKAYFLIKEASKDGGKDKIAEIELQFNPKDLQIDKGASWKVKDAKPAKRGAKPEFTGSEPRSMSVEVFLDSTERPSYDITKDVQVLMDLCTPTPKSIQQNKPSPPFVTFGWGEKMQFEAYVDKVSVKFSLFSPEGKPLRATATVSLKEIPKEQAKQNPTSGALAAYRTHSVVAGDSLASIAFAEYQDPGLWRAIAEANRIDDPMRLVPGTSLLLPDVEQAGASR